MVVFLDTSAIFAAADRSDVNHAEATRRIAAALDARDELLLHNYGIVESAALLHRRLGSEAARRFLGTLGRFRIRWVDEPLHDKAVRRFVERRGRVSLVDEVSFLVMREAEAKCALAFDKDFLREGFQLYPPPIG